MPSAICPACQEEVPAGASEGLCPACLLAGTLEGLCGAPEPAADPAALRRCGDYELLEVLARGGMGVIYRARQPGLSRVVALKMIAAADLAAADEVRRFRLEAEVIAQLDHPNIVPVHGVGEHDGMPFFVMKLATGGSLAQRLEQAPLPPPRESATLLVKVARAVHFAHERGVLHRDLKPANILLETGGEPLVADFGLARLAQSASMTTAAVGTPAYMAPEQSFGSASVTTASDVYGLGAILYHLLTGRVPFAGTSALEVLRRAETEEPSTPQQLNPQVDRDLSTICLKCLEKTPAKRYRSAAALADDLERWLQGEPVAARPPGWHERLWKWCRRRPAAATLAAGLVLGGTALAALLAAGNVVLRKERNYALEKEREARAGTERASRSEEAMRENVYAADIFLARRALDDGHLGLARQSLQRHLPAAGMRDLRGYEWHALDQLCRGDEIQTFTGHTGAVLSAAVSPDGKLAATGGRDGRIQIMDLAGGSILKTLPDQPALGKVAELAMLASLPRRSPETASVLAKVPVDEMRMRARASSLGDQAAMAWSPDGTTLVSAGEGGYVRLWSTTDWSYRGFIPVANAVQAAWTRDSRHILLFLSGPQGTRGSGELRIYDAASLAQVRAVAPVSGVFALAEKTDRLAVVNPDGRVRIQHPVTGEQYATWGAEAVVTAMAISPDGTRLAIMHSSRGTLWDTESLEMIGEFHPVGERLRAIAFSGDGALLAAGGSSMAVELMNGHDAAPLGTLRGHEDELLCLQFLPGSQQLLTGSNDHTARLWQASPGRRGRQPLQGSCPLQAAQGEWAAGVDARGTLTCLNLHTASRKTVSVVPGARVLGFRRDGSALAVLAPDGLVEWFSPALQRESSLRLTIPDEAVTAACMQQDWLAVAVHRRETRLHRLTDGESAPRILPAAPLRVSQLIASPDGRWLAAMEWPRSLSLCDVAAGTWSPPVKVTTGITGALCFSPDGNLLATGGDDNLVTVRECRSGTVQAVLKGHRAEIKALTFSPDGRTLVSSGADLCIRLWHVPTWRELGPLHSGSMVGVLAFAGRDLVAEEYEKGWLLLPGERKNP